MTAAADLARQLGLSPTMAAALQAAGRGDLRRDELFGRGSSFVVDSGAAGAGASTSTARALCKRGLITPGQREVGRWSSVWQLTDLGAEVLAHLAGQDGPR